METGRVNQKRRTRAAIVAAARELLSQGATPTVAQAAEAALVSRTTAYRYFPTQESLLVELSMNVDVADVEHLVADPPEDSSPIELTLEVLERFNRHVADAEVEYRTALRLYLDQWLQAVSDGEPSPIVREGRRGRWFEQSLEPLSATVPRADLRRVVAALSMLSGGEALVVLRDVCHLDAEEGRAVVGWAARVLLEATFDRGAEQGSDDG